MPFVSSFVICRNLTSSSECKFDRYKHCPTTCKCRELSVDLEGIKLEQVISQNDIKANALNVERLSDVATDLKKQIHVTQEKLDDHHVVGPNLYSNVNCSNQTIKIQYTLQ